MGIRRPTPKARLVTFRPRAACLRLYSVRSTRRMTLLHHLGVEAGGDDLVGAQFFLDVPVEDRLQHVVGRQRVLVGLVGAQLGRRRLGDGVAGMISRPALLVDVLGQLVDRGLGHVADDRQPAAHVAVERAVADGQLALVAGGQQQAAELVRQGHQDLAADAGLDVLLGDVRRAGPRSAVASCSSKTACIGPMGMTL